ncbi:hypothetical protein P168DRAFT_285979 [Aspergillus campestris IBT 28561]|uniref:UBX domain-containing protein 2 n=1 Tax=Aspergillus campestris (strain IBT 28561) TaxID=1392248 RepID=A0A2I1DD20_ASPC2|nr:uncharacterized protein P168DRAFT_285979 [Aspergillus campestris IBT 28561]PKY07788.1 hypothetical protein P168DRAFT_285979 [Aspergillus campestris IBT 28561]
MFFAGNLQEGIALAVQQQKAVVCFVRDDEETSTQWEEQYFKDDEFARVLAERSVLLRLAKDAPETGFLTSFCPVTKYPTVVVILNGMLREYIVPETNKEDFQRRLRDVLEDRTDATATASATGAAQDQAQSPQPQTPIGTSTGTTATPASASAPAPAPVTTDTSAPAPVHAPAPAPVANPASSSSQSETHNTETRNQSGPSQSENIRLGERSFNVARTDNAQKSASKPAQWKPEQKPQQKSEKKPEKPQQKPQKPQKEKEVKPIPKPSGPSTTDHSEQKPKPPRGPPKEYRLQVRLFDGSSVRSSFLPSHTIRANVRPWLDGQMAEEKRPYNLKHIMTPLPNQTLSIADEEQSLDTLNLGPTANLVMIPIRTYTEAYSSTASLPVRAVSTVYGLVSSTVGAATGLVGSFLGYGQTTPAPSQSSPDPSTSSQTGSSAAGPRPTPPTGPRIRTLQDQRNEEGDKQFYNGNQLNFEPRKDDDDR